MSAEAPNRSRSDAVFPRHICIVSETFAPEINGVALTLGHLVRGLRARGHQVSVVRPLQREVDRHGRADPETVTVSGMPLPVYRGLQLGLPAGRVLRRRWSSNRPDAVYVATEGPLGWSAVGTARRMAIPAFSGFHTNFHSYSCHYGIGWLRRSVFSYLRAFHNRTVGTIVASHEVRERLERLGVRRVQVLGRAVDSGLFDPGRRSTELRRSWGVGDDGVAMLSVGRIAAEKNLQLAIDAYRAARSANPAVRLVIIGDGPLRAALERRHPDVIFRGFCSGVDLATHYASADLFVFPSETETFGNVTLEALASGLVVVAYDYAAAHVHIRHDDTGILAPLGDSRGFLTAVTRVAAEVRAFAGMRQRARDHALSLDWRHIAERFASLLTVQTRNEEWVCP